MRIEEDIAHRLALGTTVQELIAAGYKRSTVYKVAASFRIQQGALPDTMFTVDMRPDRGPEAHYLPGEVAQLTFVLTNEAPGDLYVLEAGVQPEWLAPVSQWIFSTQRRLLGPGESLTIRLGLAIPGDLPLGEKDLSFGVRGQLLGPYHTSPPDELVWSDPLVLHVQNPASGIRVFLSHSVADMWVVRQLASALEDVGIDPIIAEEMPTPGSPLDAKFAALIDQSSVLVALLTWQSVRSDWVLAEVDYALRTGKPTILLRDQALAYQQTGFEHVEWTPIDLSHGAAAVASSMLAALDATRDSQMLLAGSRQGAQSDPKPAILIAALGALVAGIAIGKSGARPSQPPEGDGETGVPSSDGGRAAAPETGLLRPNRRRN
jgi:hypothetical protein